jgi:folylpolyglutamate synthase/dihydropteroate synthase
MIQLLAGNLKECCFGAASVSYGRAESPAKLCEQFEASGRTCTSYDSVEEAIADAAKSGFECILITGSIYLAGAARQIITDNIS